MSRKAKHIEMDHCNICNGKVYRVDGEEEFECEKCGTIFRPKGDEE